MKTYKCTKKLYIRGVIFDNNGKESVKYKIEIFRGSLIDINSETFCIISDNSLLNGVYIDPIVLKEQFKEINKCDSLFK